VIRALLEKDELAVGTNGQMMTREELEKLIDPSVDHMAGVSHMSKVDVDGELLCDAAGRPLVKKF